MELVVSHYKEELGWLAFVPDQFRVTLYSKGPEPPSDALILPNIGRESHTYLYHIVENYDKLEEWTIFAQGHPFDHAPDFLRKLSIPPTSVTFLGQNKFLPIGQTYHQLMIDEYSNQFSWERRHLIEKVWDIVYPKKCLPKLLFTVFGAIFAVHRTAIHIHPASLYQELLELHDSNYVLPWSMENLWPNIFMQTYSHKACILHL